MKDVAEELARLFVAARVGDDDMTAHVESMRKAWHSLDPETQWMIQQGMASAGIIATSFLRWAAAKNKNISVGALEVAMPHVIAAAIESLDGTQH